MSELRRRTSQPVAIARNGERGPVESREGRAKGKRSRVRARRGEKGEGHGCGSSTEGRVVSETRAVKSALGITARRRKVQPGRKRRGD